MRSRALCFAVLCAPAAALAASAGPAPLPPKAKTPIRHVVVIFQENVSFDHYFATYPRALNKPGEVPFHARPGTPQVNGLNETLLTRNLNAAQPFRLDRRRAATCDQDHGYAAEQRAYDGGLMDKFVENTGGRDAGCDPKTVMAYFDGNTVTALWSYAQRFAMSDNFYDTEFGPSTPGALDVVAGQTHGASPRELKKDGDVVVVEGTDISDADPGFDDCSHGPTFTMKGRNIGDLLSAAGLTWGWFEGGFRPTGREKSGRAVCGAAHRGSDGRRKGDYVPHHEPFQYYAQTANPHHLPPSGVDKIGAQDQANHQYDLADFWAAAEAGRLPAVSYLKAPGYEDGHAGYSDPVAEQRFLVETLDRLQRLPAWKTTAVFLTYDDSDGWYDHVFPPIVNPSAVPGLDRCGTPAPGASPARCGYGARLPLLVLSPYARRNFVSHAIGDQTSILRFIEDNWGLPRLGDQSFDALAGSLDGLFDFAHPDGSPLLLDPATGRPAGR